MPFLVCRHLDKHTEWNANVAGDSFTLGCSDQAMVPLPDRELAVREAVISRDGDRFQLADLAERGRVLLNGAVTSESLLKDGDCLQLGRILLYFYEEAPRAGRQVMLPQPGRSALQIPWTTTDDAISPASTGRSRVIRLRILGLLVAAVIAGGLLGFLGHEEQAIPRWGPPPLEGESSRSGATGSEGETSSPATAGVEAVPEAAPAAPAEEDPMEKLRRQLAGSGSELSEAVPKEAAGAEDDISLALAVARIPDSSTASRRVLYRLFLDVAGRSPTRDEDRELTPLSHRDRWRAVLRVSSAPSWLQSPVDAFEALLGREPTLSEVTEVEGLVAPEWPVAFWVSAFPEYGEADRRRPRSPQQQAAAWIVDLTGRIPTSSTEIRVVRSALETRGQRDVVARTLVHSPRSSLPAETEEPASWWKDELFRFLLRTPTAREAEEIPRSLDTWPRGERRRWLLLTLASLPEYESY